MYADRPPDVVIDLDTPPGSAPPPLPTNPPANPPSSALPPPANPPSSVLPPPADPTPPTSNQLMLSSSDGQID
eukprot:6199446-Pleurochrysis_carterae.AAC.2